MSVERRRDAPYSAFSITEFALLFRTVFVKPVGWIRDHGMDAPYGLFVEPSQGFGMVQCCAAEMESCPSDIFGWLRQRQ